MGFHLRILSSYPINGSDCLHDCPGLCYDGRCFACPPPSSSDYQSTAHHSDRHLTNLIIASGCLLAVSFFLALTYYAVFGHRCRRRSHPIAAPAGPDADGVGGGEGDHHAWRIRSAGLDDATIGSIAVYEYKAGDGLLAAADCSVCLGEFRDGELVRLLPKCGHAFHVHCIDTWLHAHVNCPLCRANIVAPTADSSVPPRTATAVARSTEGDSGSSALLENTQMGIQPLESDRGASEGESEDGGTEFRIPVVIGPSAALSCPPSRVPSDLGDGDPQPVRRSVSMISFPPHDVLSAVETEEISRGEGKGATFGDEQSSKNRGKEGNASKEASIQKGHPEMEKTQSSSGIGSLFSKYGRTRSSILPL